MANHKSAEKRARQTIKRTERNRALRSRVRNASKKADAAIASKDKKATAAALSGADKELQKMVNKGVLHKKTAARKMSRLAKRASKAAKAA